MIEKIKEITFEITKKDVIDVGETKVYTKPFNYISKKEPFYICQILFEDIKLKDIENLQIGQKITMEIIDENLQNIYFKPITNKFIELSDQYGNDVMNIREIDKFGNDWEAFGCELYELIFKNNTSWKILDKEQIIYQLRRENQELKQILLRLEKKVDQLNDSIQQKDIVNSSKVFYQKMDNVKKNIIVNYWKCDMCNFDQNFNKRLVCFKCGCIKENLDINTSNLSKYEKDEIVSGKFMRKRILEEKRLKNENYRYLGWMNRWKKTPLEVKNCNNLHHTKQDKMFSFSGSYCIVYCEICKYYYNYDCS